MSTAGRRADVSFPQIRTIAGSGTEPLPVAAGPTLGWIFQIGDFAYVEFPLHTYLDRTQDIIFGISWAPAGSEGSKNVTWRIDIGAEKVGAIVTDIDETVDAVDVAVPAVVATYVRTGLAIPAAVFSDPDVDELHVRITRLAATADPAADPGMHHIAVVQSVTR